MYAPYALHIAIPAMMLGHLTFAGLAELFVSGGVVAYLQRTNPALLGQKPSARADEERRAAATGWGTTRPLWIRLALLMLLDASGNSGGGYRLGGVGCERFFRSSRCGSKSRPPPRNVAPPSQQPQGLARLSALWSAPFPQYAPPFVRRPAFGYVMSAVFGSGLILGFFLLIAWMAGGRGADAPGLHHDT